MTKAAKLRLCNWSLLIAAVLILASGIQLEATHGDSRLWVWIHVIVGVAFSALGFTHIYLHFSRSNWFKLFSKLKSHATQILWWLFLLTVLSGLIAIVHWLFDAGHSPIGSIHGKLGFLMIVFAAAHTVKRFKFFTK